ncbi:acetyltransferase [Bacillus sp. FJAT-27231]|uniref:GNAT family N-acetyltransferase n=1 Tax=Bacillus sp. FJAT-27231 TaxID=1679168 RepID=UPI000670D59E|nr:GNAT family protein [Bacillus sp. FJAT-27231]KMY54110.1 acetyltransferase [Bacillus sp. FJAT-27231]
MNIRILKESDAKLYQEIRLSALKVNPEAFGSTYEREVDFSVETIKERIKPTKDQFILGSFNDSGSLVGIVTFIREDNPKANHKGNIFGLYVIPERRGQGLGKTLIAELIRQAQSHNGLEQIRLTVVSDNDPAKKLYKSLGFKVYGIERNALKFNGKYFDEVLMVLQI